MSIQEIAGDASRSTDQRPKASAMKAGQVILIPKQLRAEWMDIIALDPKVSHVAFRAAGVIGSHFNRYTGDTFLSQEMLARVMCVSERTVWTAVGELERLGYLIVKRRELGTLTRKRKDGTDVTVRVAGGKGVANTYLPAFERSQVAATNTGLKLAARCDLLWDQRSQKTTSKVAIGCDPTLTSSSKKNPTPPPEPSFVGDLGPAGALLRQRLGDDVFRSWFSKVTIESQTPDLIVLRAPTRFTASRIGRDYERQILDAWQAISPTIERVQVVGGT
jgi:biotin operon repressor